MKTDTSALRDALSARGIEWTDFGSLAPGVSLFETIATEVKRCDFVCAVFSNGEGRENVALELGLALGLSKPTLVFAAPSGPFSSVLAPLITTTARIDDPEIVGEQLDIFLQGAGKWQARRHQTNGASTVRRVTRPAPPMSAKQLAQLNSRDSSTFEDWAAALLHSAGFVVSQYRDEPDRHRADLAVWISELEPLFGNPILVECKAGDLNESQLAAAEERLRREVIRIRKSGGLLVYLDCKGRIFDQRSFDLPLILRLSADQLESFINAESLAAELAKIRNRIVHGAGVAAD